MANKILILELAFLFTISLIPNLTAQSLRSPCPEIFQYGKENGKDVAFLDIGVAKSKVYGFNVTLVFYVPENLNITSEDVSVTIRYNASVVVRKIFSGGRVSHIVRFTKEALQLAQVIVSGETKCENVEDDHSNSAIVTAFNEFKAEIDVVAEYNRVFNIGVSEEKCGVWETKHEEYSHGGERAERFKWPWVTSMYVKGEHKCSATLITRSVAITAAHCLAPNGFPAKPEDIELLLFNNKTAKIWEFVKHPRHDGPASNDVAMLFLENDIDAPDFTPVCLWEFYEDIEKRQGTIVGFGETELQDSGTLNKLDLTAVSSNTCGKTNDELLKLVNDQTFCAGGPDGTGPCRGDSGGGFMIKEANKWYLRGVVSTGLKDEYGNCDTTNFVIFMDVVKYLDWITNRKHTLTKEQHQSIATPARKPIIDSELPRSKQVFCYTGEWHTDIVDKIQPGLCTMIYIWFAAVDANGAIQADNVRRLHNFLALKPKYTSKVILSLGGYSDFSTKANFALIAASPELQKKFAESCLKVCQTYDLDGIDIHWEYPNPGDQQGYVEMARHAQKALNPRGYLLTIGSPATAYWSGPVSQLDIKGLSEVTNYMNLISHDYHGDTNVFWSGGGLNINAPINAEDNDSVEDTIKRYLNYTIPGKLTLGIPMYARWWKLKDKNQTTIGSPYVSGKQNDYAFAPAFNYYCRYLNDSTWTVVRKEPYGVPYMYRDTDWMSFEDFESIKTRAGLINKYKLAGGKIWAFEQDDYDNVCNYECQFPIMRLFNNAIGRKIDCNFIDPDLKEEAGIVSRKPINDRELQRKGLVFCYANVGNNDYLEDLKKGLCHTIVYSFATVDKDGRILISNETMLKKLLDIRPDIVQKVLVSIGGPTDLASKSNFALISLKEELRRKFVQNCLALCKKYNLDGIDIHWEFPDQRYKEAYVRMARDIQRSLNPSGYLLTIAAPSASYWYSPSNGFDIKNLASIANYLHLLSHDIHTDINDDSNGGGTDINAPINSPDEDGIEDAIKKYLEYVKPDRLILSIPMYGRWWKLYDKNKTGIGAPYIQGYQNTPMGIPAFYQYCQFLNDTTWIKVRPDMQSAPYMYHEDNWITYEDPISIKARIDLVNKYNLAGARIWSLDKDDHKSYCYYECPFPLVHVVNNIFGNNDLKCDILNEIVHSTKRNIDETISSINSTSMSFLVDSGKAPQSILCRILLGLTIINFISLHLSI